jgi:hypothetical protein
VAVLGKEFTPEQSFHFALGGWNNAVSLDHKSAQHQREYLAGIGLKEPWSDAIRCSRQRHPSGEWLDTLVVARHDPDRGDQIGGTHRIFLRNGRLYEGKPSRMSLGQIRKGRSILWSHPQRLVIAEAVEDALIARQRLLDEACRCRSPSLRS